MFCFDKFSLNNISISSYHILFLYLLSLCLHYLLCPFIKSHCFPCFVLMSLVQTFQSPHLLMSHSVLPLSVRLTAVSVILRSLVYTFQSQSQSPHVTFRSLTFCQIYCSQCSVNELSLNNISICVTFHFPTFCQIYGSQCSFNEVSLNNISISLCHIPFSHAMQTCCSQCSFKEFSFYSTLQYSFPSLLPH